MSTPIMCISYIPIEILKEIFFRLPLDCIAILRLVCKFWRDITLDSFFIDAQLRQATPKFFVQIDHSVNQSADMISSNLANGRNTSSGDEPGFTLVGSTHGLLCYKADQRKKILGYVCNPVTRERITFCRSTRPYQNICGFYFQSSTRKYKVLGWFPCGASCHYETLIVGTDSWKLIDNSFMSSIPHLDGRMYVSANGALHWLVKRKYDYSIVSFDIEKEIFKSSTLEGDYNYNSSMHLMEADVGLSLLIVTSGTTMELGIFLDYENCIWTKICSISIEDYKIEGSFIPSFLESGGLLQLTPISLQNGVLFFQGNNNALFSYHRESNSFRKVHFTDTSRIVLKEIHFSGTSRIAIRNYVESLVSPVS